MTDQRQEALKMAIEALEQAHSLAFKEIAGSPPDEVLFEDAIQACKDALEQPAQEPVAWVKDNLICPENGYETTRTEEHPKDLGWTPLYIGQQAQLLQEPVAWMHRHAGEITWMHRHAGEITEFNDFQPCQYCEPLYTHPAQQKEKST
jgi:hypothetical protein